MSQISRFHTDPWVNIVDPGDETVEVRKMNWRSFRTLILRETETSLDLVDKICYLLSFCTVLNAENHIYGLWIQLNENEDINRNLHHASTQQQNINFKLVVSLSHYMSNTTLESTLQRTCSKCGSRIYFLIQIFEEGAFSKGPLLTLRVDRYGEYGELVWLQKGNMLSGQTMLHFCIQFIDYLNIKSCYLMDSAQINLINIPFAVSTDHHHHKYSQQLKYHYTMKDNKIKKAHLRLIHLLTDKEGVTWYEAHGGFKRININRWPLVPRYDAKKNGKKRKHNTTNIQTISQNVASYEESIRFVRNMKLKEIEKYLSDTHKLHLNAMITYYNELQYEHDIAANNKNRDIQRGRNRYRDTKRGTVRERSRSRNRSNSDNIETSFVLTAPLQTIHDLFSKVHCSALHAPTKWKKLLGQRHLRILYDILIDPLIAIKTKKNGFLLFERGRKYLNALEEIMNFRVYCRGSHRNDRVNGVIKAKNITKHQIYKFMRDFEQNIEIYQEERKKNRRKYKMYCKHHRMDEEDDDDAESENNENEIRLSLNIKNNDKSNSYKHEISIDSNSGNNNNYHQIKIKVNSIKRVRRRSRRLSNSRINIESSDDDI